MPVCKRGWKDPWGICLTTFYLEHQKYNNIIYGFGGGIAQPFSTYDYNQYITFWNPTILVMKTLGGNLFSH